MFDRLIESNSVQAEFTPRRKFFLVSSVIVGIAFLCAVVIDLYAKDIDIGNDSFELSQLLAPVAADAPEPEPAPQPRQTDQNEQTSELPSRQKLIARIDEPQDAPSDISTTINRFASIPKGDFVYDPGRPDSNGSGTIGNPGGGSSSAGTEVSDVEPRNIPEPPPAVIKTEPKKRPPQTKGVMNGYAISLPKPPYPPAAKAINITGEVNVQVLIDEQGNVISAKAVTGHFTLKGEAERAAWKAKFKPTYLSDEPVKVTGVIVYRFTR